MNEASPILDHAARGGLSNHPTPTRRGRIAKSNARALRNIGQVLAHLADARDAMLLVRNVLHQLGIQCSIRRKGDTNVRIDAIIAFDDGTAGIAEVELGGAVLESPRAILEDIAVLHGRYAFPLESIVPISIILALPNARSEYYQVIDDVRRVLNIRIHTLTMGVLLILLWNCAQIESLGHDEFITEDGGGNLTISLLKALGGSGARLDGEPYPGALETAK
jgi:hypothetical protein